MTFTCILGWIYYAIAFGCQPSRYDCDDDVLNEKGAISFFVDRHAQGYGITHCSCSLNRIDKTAGPRRRLRRKPSGWLKRQRKKLPSISLRSFSSHYPKSPLTRSVYWMLLYHVNCAFWFSQFDMLLQLHELANNSPESALVGREPDHLLTKATKGSTSPFLCWELLFPWWLSFDYI